MLCLRPTFASAASISGGGGGTSSGCARQAGSPSSLSPCLVPLGTSSAHFLSPGQYARECFAPGKGWHHAMARPHALDCALLCSTGCHAAVTQLSASANVPCFVMLEASLWDLPPAPGAASYATTEASSASPAPPLAAFPAAAEAHAFSRRNPVRVRRRSVSVACLETVATSAPHALALRRSFRKRRHCMSHACSNSIMGDVEGTVGTTVVSARDDLHAFIVLHIAARRTWSATAPRRLCTPLCLCNRRQRGVPWSEPCALLVYASHGC